MSFPSTLYKVERNSNRLQWMEFFLTPVFGVGYLLGSCYSAFVAHRPDVALLWLLAAAYVFPAPLSRLYGGLVRFAGRRGYNGHLLVGILLGGIGGTFFLAPVYAQAAGGGGACSPDSVAGLFEGAQRLMLRIVNDSTTGAAANTRTNMCNIVNTLINTMRAVFIIYLIVGLVQVINAIRQGEEWKDVAKIPLLVFMIGVFGDLLIKVIAG